MGEVLACPSAPDIMRSPSSALTQQAVSTPRGPVPNERRRRRPPHGRRTGTTGEWPPATRGSPPAPAKDGPGRGPPPRGRVRSRCTSRGARTRPGTRASPANVSRSPPDARRTTLCPGVWPPVRWTTTPGATSYSFSNVRSWLWYSFKNRLPVRRSASGNPGGMETREKSGDSQNSASAAATWTRRSGRSRSFTPSASSPPQWSMCMWVSTTSVTDAGSMPAASSRWANCPARGKSGNSPLSQRR